MRDQTAFFLVGESEVPGEIRQLGFRNRQEFPALEERRIFAPGAGETIGAQNLGRVMFRIEADAEQMSLAIARRVGPQLFVDRRELVAYARAEIGKRATRVDQR